MSSLGRTKWIVSLRTFDRAFIPSSEIEFTHYPKKAAVLFVSGAKTNFPALLSVCEASADGARVTTTVFDSSLVAGNELGQ